MRAWLIATLILLPVLTFAAIAPSNPQGYHWYTLPQHHASAVAASPQKSATTPVASSPYAELKQQTAITRNVLAKALLNPTVDNTARYMRVQQYWARKNQAFVQAWEAALLQHPELDHRLSVPTDNGAIALKADAEKARDEQRLHHIAQHAGLLFFYDGNASLSRRFATLLLSLIHQYHFAMMSVCVSGQPMVGLPHPAQVPFDVVSKRLSLKRRYLPALFYVDLKTQQYRPVSFGFLALTDLKARLIDVVMGFKRFSYNGDEAA